MDMLRVRSEVAQAMTQFAYVALSSTRNGSACVQAVFQTSDDNKYAIEIHLDGYPIRMPKVFITKPALAPSPHKYNTGNICYLHPNMWNPGRHNLTFVLARAAKWLNKYDVYRRTKRWPGAGIGH